MEMGVAFYYIFEEETSKRKIKFRLFIRRSEINYANILLLQANQQTLEEGQNFIDLKNTLH